MALAAVAAYALTPGECNDYALYSVMGAALVVGGSVGEVLVAGLLSELQQIRAALQGMRDGDSSE